MAGVDSIFVSLRRKYIGKHYEAAHGAKFRIINANAFAPVNNVENNERVGLPIKINLANRAPDSIMITVKRGLRCIWG